MSARRCIAAWVLGIFVAMLFVVEFLVKLLASKIHTFIAAGSRSYSLLALGSNHFYPQLRPQLLALRYIHSLQLAVDLTVYWLWVANISTRS